MAFTAFPIPTATILQHPTISVDAATAYILVQSTGGSTGKLLLTDLLLLIGVPEYADIAAFEADPVTATLVIVLSDGNGASGIFTQTGASGIPDGVNVIEDSEGTLFRRFHLT